MEPQNTAIQPKKGGNVSKVELYNIISPRGQEIVEGLFELTKPTHNENVRLGALKTLINKILPDLQAIQHKGEVTMRLPNIFIPKEKDDKPI